MKYSAISALLLAAAPSLMAQTAPVKDTSPPTIEITTPSINSGSNIVLAGTAADTGSGTGTSASTVGVLAVYYQEEGSSKWKKALLTSKGAAETTWVVQAKISGAAGKRYYFRAVDRSGNESDVKGRRFRRGS
ncbi:MAG: hypothetical protein V4726_11420 [Verrucomicrobiota bacterium]